MKRNCQYSQYEAALALHGICISYKYWFYYDGIFEISLE